MFLFLFFFFVSQIKYVFKYDSFTKLFKTDNESVFNSVEYILQTFVYLYHTHFLFLSFFYTHILIFALKTKPKILMSYHERWQIPPYTH